MEANGNKWKEMETNGKKQLETKNKEISMKVWLVDCYADFKAFQFQLCGLV